MLEKIKLALRLKTDVFNDEINMYIVACKNELIRCGVDKDKYTEENETIINTTIAYCKWMLNFQNQGDRWKGIYTSLKTSLALDSTFK
jgi:hypothetical protein